MKLCSALLCSSLFLAPTVAAARDDANTTDRESGVFEDDGAPVGGEVPTPICSFEPMNEFWFDWQLSSSATFTLPAAGSGKSWTIEYRARGRDVDLSWTTTGQGSPTVSTTQTLSPPASVTSAAATTPLALTSRVVLKTTSGSVVNVRQARWLILDKRTGTMQYQRWADHVWPTLTNAQGQVFTIADLDWNAQTAIQTTAAFDSFDAPLEEALTDSGDVPYESGEGTFFPEELGDSALGSIEPPTDETGPIDIEAEEAALVASATVDQVVVTFCVEVKVNFADVGNPNPNPAGLGEDYFTSNTDKYARGHLIYASGPASGGQMQTWVSSGTTSGTPGCGTLVLKKNSRYDIWVRSDIVVDTQHILVNRQPGNGTWQGRVLTNYPAPTVNQIRNATTAVPHQAWVASSVTSWGLYRREVPNISNAEVHTDVACPSGGTGACTPGKEVYLGDRQFEKRVVAHEFGHAVGYVTDDSLSAKFDYSVVGANVCKSPSNGHLFPSKEYSSAAAVEGFANYYAAVVFNNTGQSDCALETTVWDFDGNGSLDVPFASMAVVNCEGQPYWGTTTSWTETSHNQLADPCDGVKGNRGVSFDWTRMFWDLDTDEALSFSKILEVWDRANTHSWRKDDTGISDKPWERVLDAADDANVYTVFGVQGAYQGTDQL